MNLSTECLEASQVDSLLQGNLTPEEYESAQDHLELCESCRARVEATIGPEQWWSDVQSVLLNSRTGSFSQRNASSADAEPNDTHRRLNFSTCSARPMIPTCLVASGPMKSSVSWGKEAWAQCSKDLIDRSIGLWRSRCCYRIWLLREPLANGSLAKAKRSRQWSMIM